MIHFELGQTQVLIQTLVRIGASLIDCKPVTPSSLLFQIAIANNIQPITTKSLISTVNHTTFIFSTLNHTIFKPSTMHQCHVWALLGSSHASLGFDCVPPNFDCATLSFDKTQPEFDRAPACFDRAPPPFERNSYHQTLFDRIPPGYDLAPPSLDRDFTHVGHDHLAPPLFDRKYHQNLQIEQHNFQIEGDYKSGWNFCWFYIF